MSLSDKMYVGTSLGGEDDKILFEKDVKEFIKELKEKIAKFHSDLDELVGEKLI